MKEIHEVVKATLPGQVFALLGARLRRGKTATGGGEQPARAPQPLEPHGSFLQAEADLIRIRDCPGGGIG